MDAAVWHSFKKWHNFYLKSQDKTMSLVDASSTPSMFVNQKKGITTWRGFVERDGSLKKEFWKLLDKWVKNNEPVGCVETVSKRGFCSRQFYSQKKNVLALCLGSFRVFVLSWLAFRCKLGLSFGMALAAKLWNRLLSKLFVPRRCNQECPLWFHKHPSFVLTATV